MVVPAFAVGPFTATWTLKSIAKNYPDGVGGRGWEELTYDTDLQKVVLFGGSGATYFNDIQYYDVILDTWTQIEPFVGCGTTMAGFSVPPGRDEQTLEYDPVNKLYWSVGGTGYKCAKTAFSAKDGSSSLVVVDPSLTGTVTDQYKYWTVQTAVGAAFVTAYDPVAKKLTLDTSLSDLKSGATYYLYAQRGGGTWSYSPATRKWTGYDGPYWGSLTPNPGGRLSPASAFSTRDNMLLLFAGNSSSNDTWAFDVTTKKWIKKLSSGSAGSPPPLSQLLNGFIYDPINDVFVLHGGRCMDNAPKCANGYYRPNPDTWVYRYSTNTWTKMNPAGGPGPREQQVMYYDPVNRGIVLFGGRTLDGTLKNDLWFYDYPSNTWTDITPATSPSARVLAAATYDPKAGLGVLFSGNSPTGYTMSDIWALKIVGPATPANTPPTAVASASPLNVLSGASVAFSSTGSFDPDGTVVGYLWSFGDGTSSTAASPSKSYAVGGTYTATLTVTDNQGATASSSVAIVVSNPVPAPTITMKGANLRGQVSDTSVTQITVNGTVAPVVGGSFDVPITLNGTSTTVNLQVTGAGGTASKTVTISAP